MNADPLGAYADLERRLMSWALEEPRIRMALVVGSRALRPQGRDPFSDLDVILYSTAPQQLAGDRVWLAELGPVWAAWLNRTFTGDPEWMVLYAGGWKIDLTLAPVPEGHAQSLAQIPYRAVLGQGHRLLLDKDDLYPALAGGLGPGQGASQPSAAQFSEQLDSILLVAARAALSLQRGDWMWARALCDGRLKEALLSLAGWYAQAMQAPQPQAIHAIGHRWSDSHRVDEIEAAFSTDSRDVARALTATLALTAALARETAAAWHFPFPEPIWQEVLEWVASPKPPLEVG